MKCQFYCSLEWHPHGSTFFPWQTLLFRLTHQTDVTTGIPVAATRTLDEVPPVGHCVNMLPLRMELDPSASFADELRAVRQAVVDAHEHRAVTFGTLVRRLNLPRDPSHTPLLAAVFNVDRPTDPPRFDALTLERMPAPKSAINFELGLDIADTGEELHVECNY